jgi:hypothetical protein
MDDVTLIIGTVALGIVALLVVWLVGRGRTAALRARFGPEYDHVVRTSRTAAEAERELRQRARRVAGFSVRPLSHEDVERFTASWRSMQGRFVDDPRTALVEADRLIGEVIRARGYPVEEPDRRLDDLSVDHANVVGHYREARAIVQRHERRVASTEDLRQAMVHFRALFDELVTDTKTRRASRAATA